MARKPDTPCAVCGKLLFRGRGSLPQPTCRECRVAARPTCICPVCGIAFRSKGKSAVYCSRACANQGLTGIRNPSDGTPWARRPPLPKTTARGYGVDHQKQRAQAATHHHPDHPCARCGQPLGRMGPWLHYDHDDQRLGYLGFSHAACNRQAGARKGKAKRELLRLAAIQQGTGCPMCGRALPAGHKYCTQRCAYFAHQDDPPKPKAPPKIKAVKGIQTVLTLCTICTAMHDSQGSVCSAECAAEQNRRRNRDLYRARNGLPVDPRKPTKPWAKALRLEVDLGFSGGI